MRMNLWRSMGVLALVFGFASGVSAKEQGTKSWEVDLYDDEAEITYVPDGRDDVHVYDHNNHYNDRSYIEVDRPHHGYQGGYNGGYAPSYDYGRYDRRYDYYDGRRAHVPRHYRPHYRVQYHNRYREW